MTYSDRLTGNIEADRARLAQMRQDWGQRRDWTADPREGLRQIKRLARAIANAKGN